MYNDLEKSASWIQENIATQALHSARIREIEDSRVALNRALLHFYSPDQIPSSIRKKLVPNTVSLNDKVKPANDQNWKSGKVDELHRNLMVELVKCSAPRFSALEALLPAVIALAAERPQSKWNVFLAGAMDPITSDERDGYVQRIRFVDSLASKTTRIYLSYSTDAIRDIQVTWLSDAVVKVVLCGCDTDVQAFGKAIINTADVVYLHSILPMGDERLRRALLESSAPLSFDMHGAVPEEFLMHGDRQNSLYFDEIERLIAKSATAIIVVSNQMKSHLVRKYNVPSAFFNLVPIIDHELVRRDDKRFEKITAELPTVIYAGGAQIWQCVPDMCDLIMDLEGKANFQIFTPDIKPFETLLFKGHKNFVSLLGISLRSGSRVEVFSQYSDAHYGLMLRRESVVNQVACPTKLIEYIAHGIVPIAYSDRIGDMASLGLKFIKPSSLRSEGFPSEAERRNMAEHNLLVFKMILSDFTVGMEKIVEILNGK